MIWGGNYFSDYLPPRMRFLVWDKMAGDFSMASCELAWTNQHKAARIFHYSRGEALQDYKCHPTQKPLALMEWCWRVVGTPRSVLDPFMGSGTMGVVCKRNGVRFIGIEREQRYLDIAIRRIESVNVQEQMQL